MKLKNKMIVLLLIIFAILLVVPSMVSAATVEYTRTIPSNEGTIKLNFTGLELDVAKAYEFALVRQGGTPENWFSIDDGYTETTATITLSSATSAITDVLKATDTGFIYIREKDDTSGTYILEAHQVNLKLPYLKSLVYTKTNASYDLTTARLYGTIGNNYIYTGGNHTYIYWEKVTDEEIIEDYLYIKNNNGSITGLEESLPTPPETEYTASRNPDYTSKNDGLYLLWVYRTGENCKDVYSCIIHDGLPEATTVGQYIQNTDLEAPVMENLRIEYSSSFEYNESTGYNFISPGTTITIKATFDEVIYGNTAPTLKIKCGNGEEIIVPAGTITGKYILYNYTIKEQDEGIIAVVSMTGGDVADEDENAVTGYTCPVLYTNRYSYNTSNTFAYANGSGATTETDDNEDGEWTDFSNAKFELERTDLAGANLKISDVTIKEGSHYYLFITSNSNKPNVTSDDENKIYLSYNNESKKFNTLDVAKYVELNQELYAIILEVKSDSSEKIVLSGKKLEKYAEPKYSDAFFASFMTDRNTQLLTSFTHDSENNRNIQIKIGKITDLSILSKIKNQDTSGFASLLTFARSNDGMYNKTLAAQKDYYRIGYNAGEGSKGGNSVIGLDGLKDGEYYFLYIKPDTENGKYITQEAVTLAQASVHEDGEWYLFFYGDEDFEWADFGDVEEDNSKAPGQLPDTGKFTIISILTVTAVAGVVCFIKTKKYKGI